MLRKEQPFFGAKEEDSDNSNININKQQDNKGEDAKEKGFSVFYVFFIIWVLFCGESFFI
jgi:hypothetical protein